MFGDVVMEVEHKFFEETLDGVKNEKDKIHGCSFERIDHLCRAGAGPNRRCREENLRAGAEALYPEKLPTGD